MIHLLLDAESLVAIGKLQYDGSREEIQRYLCRECTQQNWCIRVNAQSNRYIDNASPIFKTTTAEKVPAKCDIHNQVMTSIWEITDSLRGSGG